MTKSELSHTPNLEPVLRYVSATAKQLHMWNDSRNAGFTDDESWMRTHD